MRIRNSLLIALTRLASSIIPSFLGIILNNLILRKFGPDIHGLSGTISQIITLLTLFEGGYSLAANVALYKPYISEDWDQVNAILTAVRKIFTRIGIIIAVLSVVFAFVGPLIIKSALDYNIISVLILITSVGTISNIFLLSKYSVMYSAAQMEYKTSLVYLVINIFAQALSLVLVLNNYGIVAIRLASMLINLLGIPIIIHIFRKDFPKVIYHFPTPDYSIVQSTKNVFAQKIASLIFSSTDMVVLSTVIGTVSTSVYAVYNMVFTFAKQVLFSFILAPFNAFGQLQAEGDIEKVAEKFRVFQFLSVFIINAILTTVMVIILPFVSLYTSGVPNTDYVSVQIAILFGLCIFLELISNIYGLIANSAGLFFEMKKIASIGALVNIVISISLVKRFSVTGVLLGTVVSYIVMDTWQMYLVHFKQLNSGFPFAVKLICINLMLSVFFILVSKVINFQLGNYLILLVFAASVFAIISSILLVIGIMIFPNEWCLAIQLLGLKFKKGKMTK